MARFIAQVVVLGSQVIGRAFVRAFREEYVASQAAARRSGHGDPRVQADTNIKMNMTLDEAKDILNVKTLDEETIKKQYEHLFTMNDKSKGGSLYLQSKVTKATNFNKDIQWQPCLSILFSLYFNASIGFTQFHSTSIIQQATTGLLRGWRGYKTSQVQFFSTVANNEIFSDFSKERFIKNANSMKATCQMQIKSKKEAAVLVPLGKVKGIPSVLLTMRSSTVGRNKGDVSFPGGMREISDKDVIDIAIRETEEEIGFKSNIDVWTTMTSFPSRTGEIKVTPVVANIGEIDLDNFKINKDEVEYVFALPLEALCYPTNWYYTQYKSGYVLPVYIVNGFKVWGLTAGVLHYLLKLLLPESYNFKIKSKPDRLKIPSCK